MIINKDDNNRNDYDNNKRYDSTIIVANINDDNDNDNDGSYNHPNSYAIANMVIISLSEMMI